MDGDARADALAAAAVTLTSQMALAQRSASNKKKTEQIDDLKAFIARFSANASKSRQASSRKKLLDKITLDDIRPSNRKYPFIQFKAERALATGQPGHRAGR